MNILEITGIIQAVICGVVFIVGLFALLLGGWRAIKEFFIASKKMNLFIDKMMPDILDHLSKSDRIPDRSLSKWTGLISSSDNFKTSSPLGITENGNVLIKKVGLDIVFEKNKDEWIKKIDERIQNKPASKYVIENECVSFVSEIFDSSSVFKSIQNYLYENPTENKYDFVVMTGLLLRDYYFNKYPNNVFQKL